MDRNYLAQIIKCNEMTRKYGLILSQGDVAQLMSNHRDILRQEQRIEFGRGVIHKLIYEFCDSAYISQEDYAETLMELEELFYAYKNQCLDMISDDGLIKFMKKHFEGECQGSLQILEETYLDKLAVELRARRPLKGGL